MKTRALAKILVEESLGTDGWVDSARVSAVCDYVEANVPEARKVPLLRTYATLLKPAIGRGEALVESSGAISDEAFDGIKKFVAEQTGRAGIVFRKVENSGLLGGVRITCGDDIWERSVKSDLESLR